MTKTPRKFKCAECGARMYREPLHGLKGSLIVERGQLTQCECCLTMLEYVAHGNSLGCRRAPQQRIKRFHQLARENSEPTLAELIDYARTYRGM